MMRAAALQRLKRWMVPGRAIIALGIVLTVGFIGQAVFARFGQTAATLWQSISFGLGLGVGTVIADLNSSAIPLDCVAREAKNAAR